MTPDPNLVVERLREIQVFGLGVTEALSHAEAIAEMWDWTMPQAAAIQELIAAAREAVFTDPDESGRHGRLDSALKPFEENDA